VGVLHKDIKPSNILIAVEGGQPRPELADFGIGMITDRSKLVGAGPVTASGFTHATIEASSYTGTRIYVPPEVLVGRPFTVQGDVYALGVLLYQMVVGDLNRPLAEGWQRDVTDELLREDVALCVDGDATRRLSSAADLAKRLRSLPERRAWKAREAQEEQAAARRRQLTRLVVTGSAILLILLGIATAFALRERTLRREAEAARAAEEKQRALARGVNTFLDQMLTSVEPDRALGKDVTVARAVDDAYAELTKNRGKLEPEVQASILSTLGRAYRSLGQTERGERLLRESLEMATNLYGAEHKDTAQTRAELAITLRSAGKLPEAEAALRGAVDTLARAAGPDHNLTLTYALNRALVLMQLDRLDEAEPIAQHVYDRRKQLDGPDDDLTITALETLAGLVYQRGDYQRAADMFTQVWDARKRTVGADHPLAHLAGSNAATVIHRAGRSAEADPILASIIDSQRASLGEEHPRTLKSMENRADVLEELERFDEAVALQRQILEIRTKAQGPEHLDTLASRRYLGSILRNAKRHEEAADALRETLEVQRRVLGDKNVETIKTMSYLAVVMIDLGQVDDGAALHRQVVETAHRTLGPAHPTTLVYRQEAAGGMYRVKRYDQAEALLLPGWEAAQSAASVPTVTRHRLASRLARLYEAWGKPEQAARYNDLAAAATQPATTSRFN
jgi:tetratricopeptide (TPR) repeat protein